MQSNIHPIPANRQAIWKIYRTLQRNAWLADEISFGQDANKISATNPMSQHSIAMIGINSFFKSADSLIVQVLDQHISAYFADDLHISQVYKFVSCNEFIHQEAYELYIRALPSQVQDIINAPNNIAQRKMDWLAANYELYKDNISVLLIIQLINEAIFFSSSFAIIFNPACRLAEFKALNQLINRDEALHIELTLEIISMLEPADPKLATKLFCSACDIEVEFMSQLLGMEGLPGLNPDDMEWHIMFMCGYYLRKLGAWDPFHNGVCLPYMITQSISQQSVDFFSSQPVDYIKPRALVSSALGQMFK